MTRGLLARGLKWLWNANPPIPERADVRVVIRVRECQINGVAELA